MPRNTLEHLLRLLDRTLKPAVGEGVPLIEVKVALIGKEAVPGIRVDVLDVAGVDDRGREVDEVFSTWFHLQTVLSHHWELSRISNEDFERLVLLIESAKGHCVGMEI